MRHDRADRNGQRNRSRGYDSSIGLGIALLAFAVLAGCRSSVTAAPKAANAAPAGPAAEFQSIRSEFLHGDLDASQQKSEKARREFSAVSPEWSVKFGVLEAEILTYQGHRPEVLALLNSPGVTYPVSGDLAIKRNLLCALAHVRLGQTQQANTELQEAQRLSDASHSELEGEVLQTEAVVETYRNQWPEAADLFQKSLQVARERRDSFLEASDLLNLGYVATHRRHYDEGLTLLGRAKDSSERIQARAILEVAAGDLGLAYFHLGDFEKALVNFQEAEKEARETGTTSLRVDWLMDAGSSYVKLDKLQEAKTCFDQSIETARAIDAPAEIADIQTNLAFLLYQQGQLESAKAHYEDAVRAITRTGDKSDELPTMYLQALLAARQENERNPEKLLLQVSRDSAADPALEVEIDGALADFYAGKQQATKAGFWYRKSIRSFEEQRAAIADEELRLPFFANGDALYRRYADFLIATRRSNDALQLLDISRARTLTEGLGLAKQQLGAQPERAVDEQAVARKLNSVILFYSLGPEKSWMWVVTARRTQLFPLPGQSTIEVQIKSYQNAILKSSDPLRDANLAAQMLYDTLVGPAASMIPKGANVMIVPDGILNGLNFETLLTSESGSTHYWIEDVTIRNANSIHMLSQLDPGSSAEEQKKLLLIGNPTTGGTGYDTLVNAFAEIRGIAKHFPKLDETIVTQSEAVPAAYAENKPDEFSYIHFVAHGTASRLDPLDSAVVLSPPPDNPENFKLYARDIMRYPLHARLVTISACYGSGLRSYAGEGLVGLSWAFLRAGAHNVIGALWEVNDASTPLLMDRLYEELAAGSPPDAALRKAKLSLIHSQAVYRKPLYWAGFQLYTGS
jgi:CHAT domain-containing protein/Flp pilus assembly protein TadD